MEATSGEARAAVGLLFEIQARWSCRVVGERLLCRCALAGVTDGESFDVELVMLAFS